MNSFKTSVRVRYAETDKMGVVYHGNYAQYFEIGRVEWLRNLGISYAQMEQQGIILPVVSLTMNYKRSAFYDEILTIVTILKKCSGVKIEFDYEIYNEKNQLLTTANSLLVFMDSKTNRPCGVPDYVLQKLQVIK
ncbi:acyl-CoA thioesterase [Myroides sp. LJL119]